MILDCLSQSHKTILQYRLIVSLTISLQWIKKFSFIIRSSLQKGRSEIAPKKFDVISFWGLCYKAFYSSSFTIVQKARVSTIISDFHCSLITEGKAGSQPVEFSPMGLYCGKLQPCLQIID
jgi:hypothetical protein